MKRKKYSWISYLVIAIMAVVLFAQGDRRYGYTSNKTKDPVNIISDGSGYYAYLPQYFVYPEKKYFGFMYEINEKYPDKKFGSGLFQNADNTISDKYYIGTALLQAPFYAVAHQVAKSKRDGSDDGYSISYRLAIQLAGLFYYIVGVISLLLFFRRRGFKDWIILSGLLLITFGTNLNFYVSYWVSMSHVYSFSMISLFLLFCDNWVRTNKSNWLILLSLILGMIVIIRPTNVLVVLILPFLFSDFKMFSSRIQQLFTKQLIKPIFALLLFAIPILLQILERKYNAANSGLYTYQNEGFDNWLTPQFWNVLFSFKKGFFVYAPAMFVALLGLFYMRKHFSRYFILGWSITLIIVLYVMSSWWCWDYGGGLGMRPMIEFLPLLLIPVISFFQSSHNWLKIVGFGLMFGGIYLYQIFQIQYNKDIIHFSEMNQERFWQVFLKTDDRYGFMLHYPYESFPENQTLKKVAELPYNSNEWKWDGAYIQREKFIIPRPNLDELTIVNNGTFNHLELEGMLTVANQANNPFIHITYYKDSNEVKSLVSPFGNQIDDLKRDNPIHLYFNNPPEWDSCVVGIHHGGNTLPYHALQFNFLK